MALAPNGDIYVKFRRSNILALRDTDGDGRADVMKEFGPTEGSTHIMFHDGWLYHSTTTGVYRYKLSRPASSCRPASRKPSCTISPRARTTKSKPSPLTTRVGMIVEVGSPFNVYSDGDRQFGAKGKTNEEVAEFQKPTAVFGVSIPTS